jgi:type III restriction enzyme
MRYQYYGGGAGVSSQETPVINAAALEPLFEPWEEPTRHRVRAKTRGAPPEIRTYRRPSPVKLVNPLRAVVKEWRDLRYPGASETTRELLAHWFDRPHRHIAEDGSETGFRYYFCQREAIETLIYLLEVRSLSSLSALLFEFGGITGETEALGIRPEDDEWARYAFKLATGAGKTKCMSLAIVWSYFHVLRESDSPMAKHFVVIAPNLTVFERLKQDFRPEMGGSNIFAADPLIPTEWRGDWNLSVRLQDEAGGATGGVLYLTNIHRLLDSRSDEGADGDNFAWAGPKVSKSKAPDAGFDLRNRIAAHGRVMVFNDEAHHVWDPGSAWNQAIRRLHDGIKSRGGDGVVSQLDFSATPKDNSGRIFPHVVCDTPLGEAVDAGIVKTPVLGRTKELIEQVHDDAAYRFEAHLRLGYERWRKSQEEWRKSGKKPLLFVMCENTEAADQISKRLNNDSVFSGLNQKTINLHTNLKGKVKTIKQEGKRVDIFVEDEKAISDHDLRAIRRISRELDNNTSPYNCIVSVLMLREGWDVRNVTTIVPLRPYSSGANILPEQTLGRGLRRMTPPGQANELVTVIEHPAFASLYQQELEQEGLPIEVIDVEDVPPTTITIFPDQSKDFEALDIMLPALTAAHEIQPKLEGLTLEHVREKFRAYRTLPLGNKGATEVQYEGRHLITDEVIEEMKVSLPLLHNGLTAISFYVRELEAACKVQSTHATLAPLLQTFLGELLFGENVSLVEPRLTARLADQDVREHIRAVFVPLIRERTVKTEKRRVAGALDSLRNWKPFQASYSDQRPVLRAKRTLFNLVTCNRSLEVALTKFADTAQDVAAFAKNAGPQAIRIDYLTADHRLAFYTPDFFLRTDEGVLYLIETKGRQDRDVPRKAMAAIEWCKSASRPKLKWEYVFIPQNVMEGLTSNKFADLVRSCAPARQNLLSEMGKEPELPLFARKAEGDAEMFFGNDLARLSPRAKKAAEEALEIYRYLEKKADATSIAPMFTVLLGSLDEAAKAFILKLLQPMVPTSRPDQQRWFEPDFSGVPHREVRHFQNMAASLKRALVYGTVHSAIGLTRSCLDHAVLGAPPIGGVFAAVRKAFAIPDAEGRLKRITDVNDFRNTYVAHHEKPLTDRALAETHLRGWVTALASLRD